MPLLMRPDSSWLDGTAGAGHLQEPPARSDKDRASFLDNTKMDFGGALVSTGLPTMSGRRRLRHGL